MEHRYAAVVVELLGFVEEAHVVIVQEVDPNSSEGQD